MGSIFILFPCDTHYRKSQWFYWQSIQPWIAIDPTGHEINKTKTGALVLWNNVLKGIKPNSKGHNHGVYKSPLTLTNSIRMFWPVRTSLHWNVSNIMILFSTYIYQHNILNKKFTSAHTVHIYKIVLYFLPWMHLFFSSVYHFFKNKQWVIVHYALAASLPECRNLVLKIKPFLLFLTKPVPYSPHAATVSYWLTNLYHLPDRLPSPE